MSVPPWKYIMRFISLLRLGLCSCVVCVVMWSSSFFTNPVESGRVLDVCLGLDYCGADGVGGECFFWSGSGSGSGSGCGFVTVRVGWCYVCVSCESGIFV